MFLQQVGSVYCTRPNNWLRHIFNISITDDVYIGYRHSFTLRQYFGKTRKTKSLQTKAIRETVRLFWPNKKGKTFDSMRILYHIKMQIDLNLFSLRDSDMVHSHKCWTQKQGKTNSDIVTWICNYIHCQQRVSCTHLIRWFHPRFSQLFARML